MNLWSPVWKRSFLESCNESYARSDSDTRSRFLVEVKNPTLMLRREAPYFLTYLFQYLDTEWTLVCFYHSLSLSLSVTFFVHIFRAVWNEMRIFSPILNTEVLFSSNSFFVQYLQISSKLREKHEDEEFNNLVLLADSGIDRAKALSREYQDKMIQVCWMYSFTLLSVCWIERVIDRGRSCLWCTFLSWQSLFRYLSFLSVSMFAW